MAFEFDWHEYIIGSAYWYKFTQGDCIRFRKSLVFWSAWIFVTKSTTISCAAQLVYISKLISGSDDQAITFGLLV